MVSRKWEEDPGRKIDHQIRRCEADNPASRHWEAVSNENNDLPADRLEPHPSSSGVGLLRRGRDEAPSAVANGRTDLWLAGSSLGFQHSPDRAMRISTVSPGKTLSSAGEVAAQRRRDPLR